MDDVKELIARLEAWGPLVSSGLVCPAAGTAMHEAAAALSRLADAEERAVEIKPLEWTQRSYNGFVAGWFADAPVGVYRVVNPNGSAFWMWQLYSWWPRSGCLLAMEGDTFDTAFDAPNAAKAAAQAHHDGLIRRALKRP